MAELQKLIRNGSSTVVCLHKRVMAALDMVPGQTVAVEVLEDRTLRIRAATLADLRPSVPPRPESVVTETVVS